MYNSVVTYRLGSVRSQACQAVGIYSEERHDTRVQYLPVSFWNYTVLITIQLGLDNDFVVELYNNAFLPLHSSARPSVCPSIPPPIDSFDHIKWCAIAEKRELTWVYNVTDNSLQHVGLRNRTWALTPARLLRPKEWMGSYKNMHKSNSWKTVGLEKYAIT